jgi:GMP synthase-like glutamine amidotransferase
VTIAVLETGGPPGDLAARFGSYPAMFAERLGTGPLPSYDVAAGALPAHNAHSGYILTGSPAGVYDGLPWIPALKEWLRAAPAETHLVGICFGHQIMAEAFGGRVEKSERGWGIGLHEYAVVAREPWMDAALSVAIPASHQDQVVAPPPDAAVTLGSEFTPYAGLAWRNRPAISFQCHPEFEPTYAKALIEARRDRLPKPDKALASLDGFNDNARMGRWIARFLGLAPSGPSS